jgi:membrane fusion protein (multidrug efflux system)
MSSASRLDSSAEPLPFSSDGLDAARNRRVMVLALAATGLLAACGQAAHHGPSPTDKTPSVGYVVLKPDKVALTTELPGRIAPMLIADVRPQVTGLIQSRNFTEGGEVHAGSLLYEIDAAPYRAALDSAEASLAKAQSSLSLARLKAARYKELVAIRAISQQDFDDSAASVQQAEADVASARAACETNRINLAYTRITAPVSGRIGRSSVTPGALVTANQTTALATVQKLDPVYVDVTQSSTAILRLRRAMEQGGVSAASPEVKVGLVLEDGSRYPLEGTLQFSDVTVDESTGAVTVRAVFPNPKAELLPGMYVRAIVTEAMEDQALLVPQQAVTRDSTGQAIAYIVGHDDRLEVRALTLGRAIGDQWVVHRGLAPGERLIVDGAQKATPGALVLAIPIRAVPSTASARVTVAENPVDRDPVDRDPVDRDPVDRAPIAALQAD